MESREFLSKYQKTLASRAGLYQIENHHGDRPDLRKVGIAPTDYKTRWAQYHTALPQGFLVHSIRTMPKEDQNKLKVSNYKSRLEKRENELLDALNAAPGVHKYPFQREWFLVDSSDQAHEALRQIHSKYREGALYKCDQNECRLEQRGSAYPVTRLDGDVLNATAGGRYNLRSGSGGRATRSATRRQTLRNLHSQDA